MWLLFYLIIPIAAAGDAADQFVVNVYYYDFSGWSHVKCKTFKALWRQFVKLKNSSYKGKNNIKFFCIKNINLI